MRKHLSAAANTLLDRCARSLDASVDDLVAEFERGSEPQVDNHSRKLVEFCTSRALPTLCCNVEESISDGSFSRLTFDMMLAWESPTPEDEQRLPDAIAETVAKDKEDTSETLKATGVQANDEVPLFYSDIMPLLVNEEQSVGEDPYVWLGSLLPLIADVTNGQFTFEDLTAYTANRLHFPAYDRFINEMHRYIQYLQKQSVPTGVKLADDEFILHVEGTARTQRVVRHIGATSWPGRLTLTNKALYFEASAVISYEDALKIDLSKPVDHQVKAGSTGPWGAPLFDKAMVYESSELPDPVILEFPEMTSSTRRDHWVALTKEVLLLHQFLTKYNINSTLKEWEMQARTILGIIRLHTAREMLRISPPVPRNFLIFTLFDELPKGDYVLEELSNNLKQMDEMHSCSASSILKCFNMSHPIVPCQDVKEGFQGRSTSQSETLESLDTVISQVREEARRAGTANAAVEGIKEEGITYNLIIISELLGPLKKVHPWLRGVLAWEKPPVTLFVLALIILITYKEWAGYAMAALLLGGVGMMQWARRQRLRDKSTDVMVSSTSDQTTMESIVSAQHSLRNVVGLVQTATVAILKIQSIFLSRAPRHADLVMLVAVGAAVFFAVVPFRFVIIALVLYCFAMNWQARRSGSSGQGDRRLKEWWNSIPVVPVRIIDDT